jgi:hypothetical protein
MTAMTEINIYFLKEKEKMAENTGKIQENKQFKKGQSGNPNGRPLGSRNKASIIADQLFLEDLQSICKAIIEKAKSGNIQVAKIILDRLLPPKKDLPITIEIPKIKTSYDILKAMESITQAIANGEISPLEGEALARILDIHAKSIELYDFESTLNRIFQKKRNVFSCISN